MIPAANLFQNLPPGLRDPLIRSYTEIVRNYIERRWEPAELNGGKLCEIIYSIVEGATSGVYPTAPSKPPQFVNACRAIEQRPAIIGLVGDRSLRILIPRLLPFIYEIRNNRGVGHVGGDVDPNYIDATAVLTSANWLMAELVRIFHGVTLLVAQATVNALVERLHPIIWEIEGTKRVLDPSIPRSDQVLLLLYSSIGWVVEDELRNWVEYKNKTHFRTKILGALHVKKLIEFQPALKRAHISPAGIKYVESTLLDS